MKPQEIDELIEIVCGKLGVDEKLLTAATRKRDVVEARQIISLLLLQRDLSIREIAELLEKNRASIYYHLEKIQDDIQIYPVIRKQFEIMKALTSPTPEPTHESKIIQKPARRLSYSFERRTENQ